MKMMLKRSIGRASWVLVPVLAGALLTGANSPSAVASEPVVVDEYRELMIVHPAVVDPFLNGGRSHNGSPSQPGGVWSLRALLEAANLSQSASGQNDFYASFFEQWLTVQTADNGATIAPRLGTTPGSTQPLVESLLLDQFSTLDPIAHKRTYRLWQLPFELIAIVYRPDLRSADGGDPGELRFVYKLVGPDGTDVKFTLNMEYALPGVLWDGTPINAQAWANNFHRLAQLPIESEQYLRTLEAMTEQVTPRLYDSFSTTMLRHIRTNELAFDPNHTWQLREFVSRRVAYAKAVVVASSVDDTPAESFNQTQLLADFVASNPVLAAPGTAFMNFHLPETISSGSSVVSFLGGSSNAGVKWRAPGSSQQSVGFENLSLLTCNGCHQDNKRDAEGTLHIPGEIEFYHVKPDVDPGQLGRARLSKFLTAEDPDPSRRDRRPGELNRRKAELAQLLAMPWSPIWLNPAP